MQVVWTPDPSGVQTSMQVYLVTRCTCIPCWKASTSLDHLYACQGVVSPIGACDQDHNVVTKSLVTFWCYHRVIKTFFDYCKQHRAAQGSFGHKVTNNLRCVHSIPSRWSVLICDNRSDHPLTV